MRRYASCLYKQSKLVSGNHQGASSVCRFIVIDCCSSAAQLDALQQQLEESNGRLLRPLAGDLVAVMLGDVLTPPERGGTARVCLS
jgi:hypothetical protein